MSISQIDFPINVSPLKGIHQSVSVEVKQMWCRAETSKKPSPIFIVLISGVTLFIVKLKTIKCVAELKRVS